MRYALQACVRLRNDLCAASLDAFKADAREDNREDVVRRYASGTDEAPPAEDVLACEAGCGEFVIRTGLYWDSWGCSNRQFARLGSPAVVREDDTILATYIADLQRNENSKCTAATNADEERGKQNHTRYNNDTSSFQEDTNRGREHEQNIIVQSLHRVRSASSHERVLGPLDQRRAHKPASAGRDACAE